MIYHFARRNLIFFGREAKKVQGRSEKGLQLTKLVEHSKFAATKVENFRHQKLPTEKLETLRIKI